MNRREIFRLITSYKASSALITAFEIGIFEVLGKKSLNLENLSKQIGAEITKLQIFMQYLEALNVVKQVGKCWKLVDELAREINSLNSMKNIISHEKNIFQNWMYPAQLEEALYAQKGERVFDLVGLTKEQQCLYDQVMYGNGLYTIALQIIRMIRKIENPVIIEYGRSRDKILNALSRFNLKFKGYCMLETTTLDNNIPKFNMEYEVLKQNCEQIKGDVIVLYNTIHYYNEIQLAEKLNHIKRITKKDSLVFIVDIFFRADDNFLSGVLIDWITHGGTNYIDLPSVEKALSKNKFRLIRNIEVNNATNNILVFKKYEN